MTPIQIAIADDHILVREALAKLLQLLEFFHVTIQASNGKEMLDKLDDAAELPTICIVDINMPVMDGYTTASAIQKKWPSIRIIALSVFESDQAILRMRVAGAKAYLPKNASVETLQNAILEVYNGKEYFPPDIRKKIPALEKSEYAKKLLTEKEIEFLEMCCSDSHYDEISKRMCLSSRTVEKYPERLGRKLGIYGRVQLALYAIQSGLVNIRPENKN